MTTASLTPQQILFYELNFLALQQSLTRTSKYSTLRTNRHSHCHRLYAVDHLSYATAYIILCKLVSVFINHRYQEMLYLLLQSSMPMNSPLYHIMALFFGPKSSNNFFDLVKGVVLFMPNHDIQVQTREGIAYIPKGSAAWVIETGNDSAIYDLHDSLLSGEIKVICQQSVICSFSRQRIAFNQKWLC